MAEKEERTVFFGNLNVRENEKEFKKFAQQFGPVCPLSSFSLLSLSSLPPFHAPVEVYIRLLFICFFVIFIFITYPTHVKVESIRFRSVSFSNLSMSRKAAWITKSLHPGTPTHIHSHIHIYTYTHTYTHIHAHIYTLIHAQIFYFREGDVRVPLTFSLTSLTLGRSSCNAYVVYKVCVSVCIGCVDMWMCVLDVWMCGYVDVWVVCIGCVDVWVCGCVDVWMCGCVDVWMCIGCVDV